MRSNNDNILSLAITDTDPHESESLDLFSIYGYSIHAKWTKTSGTLGGAVKIQVSNDNENWIDLPDSSVTILDADGEHLYNLDAQHYRRAKLVYTLTGGQATVNNYYNAKGA